MRYRQPVFAVALFMFLSVTTAVSVRQVIRSSNDPDLTTVTITSPTSSATYDAGSSATLTTLAGTAVSRPGIASCNWEKSTLTGATTGTTSWSVSSIALEVGVNRIIVACTNGIGLTATDTLDVTRSSEVLDAYYVDPATGSDSNNGTSSSTPWQTVPGTMNTGATAFKQAAWGSITTSARVACGKTILLKGGSTHDSGDGGSWRINTSYYTNTCTGTTGSTNRIVLRVATSGEWSGSSGDFTLDGTGITPDHAGTGDFSALLGIRVDSVTFGGSSTAQRLVVRDSSGQMGVTIWDSGSTLDRIQGQWLELINNGRGGLEQGELSNSVIMDSIAFDNAQCGFCAGLSTDRNQTDVGWVRLEAYNNGSGGGGGHHDGLFIVGAVRMWVIDAYIHDNVQRGADTGTTTNNLNSSVTFRGTSFSSNGTTSDGNVWQGEICFSGDDNDADGDIVRLFLIGSIIYNGLVDGGGSCAYGVGGSEIWNSVFYRSANGDIQIANGAEMAYYAVRNSIVQRSTNGAPWGGNGPNAGSGVDNCPTSNYNLFRPISANTETLTNFTCATDTYSGTARTFANSSLAGFFGANDLIGIANDINFTSIGGTCATGTFSACDFTLAAGSDAIDAGTYFMRANGAGSSATTVNVLGNAVTNDPRNYFVSPSSYLGAAGDAVRIGSCTATVTSMTSTSISFTPACTWSDADSIHYPWNDSAPDLGIEETP